MLRASKELLAARHELLEELHRQRAAVSDEAVAVQDALTELKSRQLDARDALVRTAGLHAQAALAAVSEVEAQAAEAEAAAEERWKGQIGAVEVKHARRETASSELEGRLMAARLEVEAADKRAHTLRDELHAALQAAEQRAAEVGETREQSFHNHCLLVKLLLNTRKSPENVLVQELFSEMSSKEVPLREWPNWVMTRMSGGEPLSAWL